ncbi:hypothetical protein KIW84_075697 [Lathyrus oleraceus]|uniref:Uncharacterized protein n=1 Tax=Pisum sativum TaxID=3888 RepID=A0A9D4VXH1_PEA|nr:hypothetical protein KIW84_075697 [Pisum sativum]
MYNLSESFNAPILLQRDKPIITMFEWIMNYLMRRFSILREKVEGYKGEVGESELPSNVDDTKTPNVEPQVDDIETSTVEPQAHVHVDDNETPNLNKYCGLDPKTL